MIIEFICPNGHRYEIDESKLTGMPYHYCYQCGAKLSIVNIDSMVETNLEIQVRDNISKWFKSEGIEATCELIERTRETVGEKIYGLYKVELQRRGL